YFPHSVPDDAPVGLPWADRHPRALLSGSVSQQVYPFRWACQKTHAFNVLPPQGLGRDEYLAYLGTYRYAITCNSIFEYTVAKYFEIPAMGAVLIAPPPSMDEMDLLGLRGGENCVWVKNAADVPRIIQGMKDDTPQHKDSKHYFIHHEEQIAANGQDLMHTRH